MDRITTIPAVLAAEYGLEPEDSVDAMYEAVADAMKMNENMRKYGCIDVPVLIKDAKLYVDMIRDGKTLNTREETAAISLARVTVMLALYGSKPDSILDVIHQRGWTDVTIDDVYEVRNYVLESPNG